MDKRFIAPAHMVRAGKYHGFENESDVQKHNLKMTKSYEHRDGIHVIEYVNRFGERCYRACKDDNGEMRVKAFVKQPSATELEDMIVAWNEANLLKDKLRKETEEKEIKKIKEQIEKEVREELKSKK